MQHMWIMILVAVLALTLGNPENENEHIEKIKNEAKGNILINLKE